MIVVSGGAAIPSTLPVVNAEGRPLTVPTAGATARSGGGTGYDLEFVYAEVNADESYYVSDTQGGYRLGSPGR
ncbi:hypothetical protein ACFYYM_34195 [Streptomyces erythrochromogenes]|uniref:hypothetical protein n=1 Tax=Streptomyces erythrochromogenes TaxID=285574 RepID=UPI0036993B24